MGTNQLSGKPLEDFYTLRNSYGYGLGVRTHLGWDVAIQIKIRNVLYKCLSR